MKAVILAIKFAIHTNLLINISRLETII